MFRNVQRVRVLENFKTIKTHIKTFYESGIIEGFFVLKLNVQR